MTRHLPFEIPERVMKRVMDKVTPDEKGCLVSQYSVGTHGYAQVTWKESGIARGTVCHRVAWVAAHGPIPQGMTVDHLCKNKRCVNPEHLRLLSNFENARRTNGRDWPVGQCVNGHDNSELRHWGGRWVCGVCYRQWKQGYRERDPERFREYNRRHYAKKRAEAMS